MNNDKNYEKLSSALFMKGHSAIEDFLGYDYPDDEDKNVTENRIREVYEQMPEDVFSDFYKKYVCNEIKEDNMERIVFDWNEKYELVVERNPDPEYNKEIFCYLREKGSHGCYQDIAIIRQPYFYDEKNDFKATFIPDKVQVCVYADSDNEDYTDEFEFDIYEEDEE